MQFFCECIWVYRKCLEHTPERGRRVLRLFVSLVFVIHIAIICKERTVRRIVVQELTLFYCVGLIQYCEGVIPSLQPSGEDSLGVCVR